MKLGLLVPPFIGHSRPSIVLARELARRGHEVIFLTLPDGAAQFQNSGFPTAVFGEKGFPRGKWDERIAEMGAAEGGDIFRIASALIADQGYCIVEELPDLLRQLQLDGLVMDQICYGAESVCEVLALPLVVFANALPFHRESRVPLCITSHPYDPSLIARLRNRWEGAVSILRGWRVGQFYIRHRRRLGLSAPRLNHVNELPPSLAQICQIPEFFDFPRHGLPRHFHYTGPWLEESAPAETPFPWEKLDGRPLVYASLGTLQNRVPRLHRTIAEACESLPVQMVLGLGINGSKPMQAAVDFPSNVIAVPFAPQRALIGRASLVITHAGLNSTLETLAAGVPMIAIPISHDQPGIASRVRHLGAGCLLPAWELTAQTLRERSQHVLNTPGFRTRAQECAARLKSIDGPGKAAALIEMAFRRGAPLLRGDPAISHP